MKKFLGKKSKLLLILFSLVLSSCTGVSPRNSGNSLSSYSNLTPSNNTSSENNQSFKEQTYVISFNSNGGSSINSIEVKEGELLSRPTDPVKEGFDFAGWYKNSNLTEEYDFSKPVRESFILHAKWVASIPDTYTVTFINDGKEVDKQEVANGELLEEPENPTKEGYAFLGWFINGSNERFDFSTPITSSFNLYAKWSAQEYMVTFNLNYNNLPAVQYSTENGLITFVPERDGYVFNGWWYCDGVINGTPILNRSFSLQTKVTSDNLELFAEWIEQKQYANQLDTPVVSINNNVISWDEIDNASSYQIIITARVENTTQTFEDTRIYNTSYLFDSTYDANAYTIKVRAIGDGVNYRNSSYATKTLPHKTLTAPRNFSYNEYKCILQWDEVISASYYTIKINNDTEINTYDNYYDFTNYDAGSYSLKITPIRDSWLSSSANYSFTKWYLKAPTVTAIYDGTNECYNITWTSSMKADSYKIFINGEEKLTVNKTSYQLSVYSGFFNGSSISFSVAAFDSNSDYFISPQSKELILKQIFAINYILNGGTNNSNNPSTYTVEDSIAFSAPTKTGYTFLGWFDGENIVTGIPNGSTGTVNIEARWSADLHSLSVTSEDTSKGTVAITSGSGYSDESITVVATPVGDCVFKGWYHGDAKVSDDTTYTFSMPINDYSLVAHFFTKAEEEEEERAIKYGTRPILSEDGKTLTYGLYPQKNINNSTDSTLVSVLNTLTAPESNGWYLYEGDYYAKVFATPHSSSYKFDNGATISSGITYWFKCEPITWNVLSNINGEYYVLSSVLLDAHCYYNSTSSRTIDGKTIYPNNYEYSDIRTWLNNDFYNSAFALGNTYIQTTTVDNSATTTNSSSNSYACNNTQDKVFLPSYQDYINSSYGFSTSTGSTDTRYCRTTDWARARGAHYYDTNGSRQYNNGLYWTRSPNGNVSDYAWDVRSDGNLNYRYVSNTSYSVRPGLSIKIA